VMFNCGQGESDVTKHIESCLRSLGYLREFSGAAGINNLYISPDGLTQVLYVTEAKAGLPQYTLSSSN